MLHVQLRLNTGDRLTTRVNRFHSQRRQQINTLQRQHSVKSIQNNHSTIHVHGLCTMPVNLIPKTFRRRRSILTGHHRLNSARIRINNLRHRLLSRLPLSLNTFRIIAMSRHTTNYNNSILTTKQVILRNMLITSRSLVTKQQCHRHFRTLIIRNLSPTISIRRFERKRLILLATISTRSASLQLLVLTFYHIQVTFKNRRRITIQRRTRPLVVDNFTIM